MRKLAPIGLYIFGLAALLQCDILVTKSFSAEKIANWAEIRSLIGICGVFCLVGLDQVLIRSPQSSARLLKLLAVQVPLLAIIVGGVVYWMGFLGSWPIATLLAAGIAGSLVFFQYYRSHGFRLLSQMAQQGWKILALGIVLLLVLTGADIPLDALMIGALLVSTGSVALIALYLPPSKMRDQEPEPTGDLYAIGSRFMVTSLLLSLALYAEQLVVNGLGGAEDGAKYFTHATYFLFPITLVNGYFAFLIGPWVRENHARFVDLFHNRAWTIGLAAFGYAAIVHLIGWMCWKLIAPSIGDPDPVLRAVFYVTCVARSIYVLPSGYIGVFGKPRQHDKMIVWLLVIFALVIGFFFALDKGLGISLVYAVAIASSANWLSRTAMTLWLTNHIIRSRVA